MNRTVVAIPPSYDKNEELEFSATEKYLKHLKENGATSVMTTAGTSQFNLLSVDEIHDFNRCVSQFDGQKILGVPPLSTFHMKKFLAETQKYITNNTRFIVLYPDRFYRESDLYEYVDEASHTVGNRVYIHAQTIRDGVSGSWNYTSDVINNLFSSYGLWGIKEEHPSLSKSYDFVRQLYKDIDVIVAGGSMRRFNFLESAGANALLSGIGNFYPYLENEFFCAAKDRRIELLSIEKHLFNTFMKYGWHYSLRLALKNRGFILNNRNPFPEENPQSRMMIELTMMNLEEDK